LREVQPKRSNGKPDNDKNRSGKKTNGDARNEPMLVLSDVSMIPPSVFVAWAKGRAERYTPVVENAHISPDGKLHANYAGLGRFALPLTGEALRDAGHLAIDSGGGHASPDAGHSQRAKGKKGKPHPIDSWAADVESDTPVGSEWSK
jgi:hypothetical protein